MLSTVGAGAAPGPVAAGAAGEIGDAGWRTGEIGVAVKPKEMRLGAAGPASGEVTAGVSPVVDGSAAPNQGGSSAAGRAGGRRYILSREPPPGDPVLDGSSTATSDGVPPAAARSAAVRST
ncbi:MAG: hypothetical protein SYR96_04250 [Actinomycetota bacterium]|nr:hypothetical protein [Actinomycetota bacterium]